MVNDPWYDQWEPRVNEALQQPFPFSDVAIKLYREALAMTIAGAAYTENVPGLPDRLLGELAHHVE